MIHRGSQTFLAKPTVVGAAATTTQTGVGVDTAGYDRATVVFHLASHDRGDGNETLDVKIQEAADNATFADVTSAAFAQVTTNVGTTTSGDVFLLDIQLGKRERYLRAVATPGGTTPIDSYTVHIELYNAEKLPPTQDNTAVSV